MADPLTLIKAASLAKSVAELTGLIESTEGKIDRMVHAPLGAALLALRDAGVATNPDEQVKLLDQSAAKFRDAVQHEVGVRRMQAHLGLGVCYRAKGEYPLSLAALRDACTVQTPCEIVDAPGWKGAAGRAVRGAVGGAFGGLIPAVLRRAKGWPELPHSPWSGVDRFTPWELEESSTMELWRRSIRAATCEFTVLPPNADAEVAS